MTVEVIGLTALQRRLAAISGPNVMPQIMRLIGVAAVREQKLLVHRKTGNTGRSIHLVSATAQKAITEAGGAAAYLEYGTRPHTITPKAKKALFFASQKITTERFGAGATLNFNLTGSLSAGSVRKFGNAAFVLTTLVHHPGTQPAPFMVPGAEIAVKESGTDVIVELWNKA